MPSSFLFRSLSFVTGVLCSGLLAAQPQQTLIIPLPDAHIIADQLLRGDDDIYGLGDWRCDFKFELEGHKLQIRGEIVFMEKANDFTTIRGTYYQELPVVEAGEYTSCRLMLEESGGEVRGPNIGARGYRWYKGEGAIRQARIITDTFGPDTGKIGGMVQFEPLQITLSCVYAATVKTEAGVGR